jgi:hypothetical protein
MNGRNALKRQTMLTNSLSRVNYDKPVSRRVSCETTEVNINDENSIVDHLGKIAACTNEQRPIPTSTRKTPTLKYNAKKSNTDQQQRAKTVDVIRLKTGK